MYEEAFRQKGNAKKGAATAIQPQAAMPPPQTTTTSDNKPPAQQPPRHDFATRNGTHTITVRSLISKEPDTKSFTICAHKDKEYLLRICDQAIRYHRAHGELQDHVQVQTTNKKNTHIIIVEHLQAGPDEAKTRSFRAQLPAYSSAFIVDVIRYYFEPGTREDPENEE